MGGRGQQKTKVKNKDPSLSLPPPPPPSCLPNLDSMEPSTNCPSEALSRPTNCCPAGQDLAWSKYCTSELSAAGVSYSLTTSLCQCNPFAFLHNSCSLSMPLLDAHPFINHLMSCHADWLHANMVGREVVNQGTHGWQRSGQPGGKRGFHPWQTCFAERCQQPVQTWSAEWFFTTSLLWIQFMRIQ